jgi:hypothetical protein
MNGILPQSPSLRILLALGGGILALLICLLCALTVPGMLGSSQTPTALAEAPTASSTPTGTPTGTATTASIPSSMSSPTSSATTAPSPTNSPTPAPCVPNAAFVADVTVPDNSTMAPGAPFVKTWRVRNTGSCEWDSSYSIVFAGGIALGPGTAPLPIVAPGALVEISLPMAAPAAPGSYRGIWRLRAPNGALFGPNLIVLITVLKPVTATPTNTPTATPTRTPKILIDFVKQAPSAEWGTGTTNLLWNGSNGDKRGFAVPIQGNPPMEDGTVPQLALETHPEWVTGGYIEGYYSKFPLAVQKGDQIHVKVGFLQGAGAGNVTFTIAYDDCGDSCWSDLVTVSHAYNGSLVEQVVDISSVLSNLSTPTTTFRLKVAANNEGAGQDWATWVIAQIERP